MATIEIVGAEIERDPGGILLQPEQWSHVVAAEIALRKRDPGADATALAEVIEFMREQYLATGTAPSIRALGKESGVAIRAVPAVSHRGRRSSPRRSAGSRSPEAASRGRR